MHKGGYLPIWRKFFEDHQFWREKRVFSKAEAWIDILYCTHYSREPKQRLINGELVQQNYGEALMTTRYCGLRWGWTHVRVWRFLKLLKCMGQIDTETLHKTTRIIVRNFEKYDPKELGRCNTKRNTDVTQALHRRNNTKKGNKDNNNIYVGAADGGNDEGADKENPKTPSLNSRCPYNEIIELYHNHLPQLPRVKVVTDKRKAWIKARWCCGHTLTDGTRSDSLNYWARFFVYVSQSKFLMGQTDAGPDRKPFRADLEWLVKESNFAKVIEARYHEPKPKQEKRE
jgi:hypothetical protein